MIISNNYHPAMKKCLLFGLVILLQSCLIQTKLVSEKQPGYNDKPKRIYITIVGSLSTDNFSDGLLAGLIKKLREKNIASDGLDSFGLSEQTKADFAKGTDDFKPDASLRISIQSITAMSHGAAGGNFDLTLTDTKTRHTVWTGTMDITGHLDSKLAINSAVNAIVEKLVADGVVG
jgi:hypothetical protein